MTLSPVCYLMHYPQIASWSCFSHCKTMRVAHGSYAFFNVFIILQYQTCHISGHSKMSGLLILSQTTIKFPSEFFGPFEPLSIPNINRSSLIARESRGCWERREIAEAIPGVWLMAGECPCVPGTLAMFGHSGPGARGRGNSLCPVIPRPRHMSEHTRSRGTFLPGHGHRKMVPVQTIVAWDKWPVIS